MATLLVCTVLVSPFLCMIVCVCVCVCVWGGGVCVRKIVSERVACSDMDVAPGCV